MRIRKRGLLSGARQKCDARPGEEAEPVLSAMHNFEILADMGVPSDIFDEPGEPVRVQKCPLVSSLIQRFKKVIHKTDKHRPRQIKQLYKLVVNSICFQ